MQQSDLVVCAEHGGGYLVHLFGNILDKTKHKSNASEVIWCKSIKLSLSQLVRCRWWVMQCSIEQQNKSVNDTKFNVVWRNSSYIHEPIEQENFLLLINFLFYTLKESDFAS